MLHVVARVWPNRIQELRGMRGLSREYVADRMGVHSRTVERWERSLHPLSQEQMSRLADVLDTTVPWMMKFDLGGNGNGDGQEEAA